MSVAAQHHWWDLVRTQEHILSGRLMLHRPLPRQSWTHHQQLISQEQHVLEVVLVKNKTHHYNAWIILTDVKKIIG